MSDPRASVGHNSGLNLRPRVKGVNKRQGSQTSGKRTFQRASERETEPELQLPRLIGNVAVEGRLPVAAVAFVRHVRAVVRVIEQVEDLEHGVQRPLAGKGKPLLEPHVHAVNRFPDKALAWLDRAVR